jgi:hypothetical protein
VAEQVRDVGPGAGEEVVSADNIGARFEHPLTQERPDKASTSSDQDAAFKVHG